jgi:hypothetical protein
MELNAYYRKMGAEWMSQAQFNDAHSLHHLAAACRKFAEQYFNQITE